jgi:hypothetical protein
MAVLDELKYNLAITDTSQDTNLGSIISRGKARLNGLAGVTLDFDVDGLPHELLLEYCRYAYNNAIEYFEENFSKEIQRMQLESAVIDYAQNQV